VLSNPGNIEGLEREIRGAGAVVVAFDAVLFEESALHRELR
jgi:hypothetical protein